MTKYMVKITAQIIGKSITSNSKEAFTLLEKNFFGEKVGEKVRYSPYEALYLFEKKILSVIEKEKILSQTEFENKLSRFEKNFHTKYVVYKDLRKKGHILKQGLKFGGDFTVYEKGKKPGKSHSKWVLFIEDEKNKISWTEFSSKNRVSHSTNKKLLIAIVDETEKPLYYETTWIKIQ